MATKGKVKSVLDFRDLNEYVACYTGSDMIDICEETIKKWGK